VEREKERGTRGKTPHLHLIMRVDGWGLEKKKEEEEELVQKREKKEGKKRRGGLGNLQLPGHYCPFTGSPGFVVRKPWSLYNKGFKATVCSAWFLYILICYNFTIKSNLFRDLGFSFFLFTERFRDRNYHISFPILADLLHISQNFCIFFSFP